MKRVLLTICLVLCLLLTACTASYSQSTDKADIGETIGGGYFVVVKSWGTADSFYIVYAKDTKVMYFVKWTGYQFGISPLYNADGTLQIYEESED